MIQTIEIHVQPRDRGCWMEPVYKPVKALVHGALAINFDTYGNIAYAWVVTHVATGKAIGRFATRTGAVSCLKILAKQVWHDNPNLIPEYTQNYAEGLVQMIQQMEMGEDDDEQDD